MTINFHPRLGMVLICDFNTGFQPPEMVKKRPVVVVSRGDGQTTIFVPLSTVEPTKLEKHHVEISADSLPPKLREQRCWAKCNMVCCVALWRLDRIFIGKCPSTGRRLYEARDVTTDDFELIQQGLKAVLGL